VKNDMDKLLNNKYKLERKIAQGGMSTVYLCRNIELGNYWAAKHVDKRYAGLLYEEEILKRLNHTNLPQIVDICKDETGTFIIESFIEGLSLQKKLELMGGLPVEQVIHYGLQLCEVLIYLHEMKPRPIIHKDIKPSNLLVTDYDNLLLIDFGISAGAEGAWDIGGGTMAYSAPEQLIPKPLCDARTDIYSLGILLYEMLTGVRPGDGAGEPLKTKGLIYDRLLQLSSRCSRFRPEDRCQSMAEVKEELLFCRNRYILQTENAKTKRKAAMAAIGFLSVINYVCLILGLFYRK
jgi:serine/threonine protein kinase